MLLWSNRVGVSTYPLLQTTQSKMQGGGLKPREPYRLLEVREQIPSTLCRLPSALFS